MFIINALLRNDAGEMYWNPFYLNEVEATRIFDVLIKSCPKKLADQTKTSSKLCNLLQQSVFIRKFWKVWACAGWEAKLWNFYFCSWWVAWTPSKWTANQGWKQGSCISVSYLLISSKLYSKLKGEILIQNMNYLSSAKDWFAHKFIKDAVVNLPAYFFVLKHLAREKKTKNIFFS